MSSQVVPGSGRARALVGFAVFGSFWGVWGASLPRVQLAAEVTDAQLGSALLWVGVGALLSIRMVGGLTDRLEQRVLPVTVAALGVTGVVPVFVHGVLPLSAALFVLGLSSGGMDAAINSAAVRAASGGRPLVSLAHGVFSVAVVASSLAVAALSRTGAGRAWALLVVGAILVAAAALTTTLTLPAAADRDPTKVARAGWSWPLMLLGSLAALAYLIENAWQSWGAIHLHATVGASLRVAALAPAVFALAAAAGRLSGHRVTTRIGSATLFGGCALLAAAGSALAALAHSPLLVLVGIAVAGLGTSVCAPTLIAIAGLPRYGRQGASTGTVITVAYLGFAVGPALIGLAAGATTLPTALLGIGVVAAGLALASPLLTRLSAPRPT